MPSQPDNGKREGSGKIIGALGFALEYLTLFLKTMPLSLFL